MEYLSLHQNAGKVLRLTEAMRRFAELNDWRQFAYLESERQRSLDHLFKHPDMPNAIDDIAGILRQIVVLDQESIALGEEAKRMLAEKLNQQLTPETAISAYRKNASL